jgi:hypothetical protein
VLQWQTRLFVWPLNSKCQVRLATKLGTATIGTQAGVEYVCNPDGVADLMKQLGNSGTDQPFDALLHITIVNDVPIETKIMIVHRPH